MLRARTFSAACYTIFHRLNTGSVPLSPQELRQALHPGPFLTFAGEFSEQSKPLQELLGLTKPDFRMRDVELVVRHFAFHLRLPQYRGNLKDFLDTTCDSLNKAWTTEEPRLREVAIQMDEAIRAAVRIFSRSNVFRKWDGDRYERRLNRAVFDVVACSLSDPTVRGPALVKKEAVQQAFKQLCSEEEFRSAIETTTKSKTAVKARFSAWYKALGSAIGKKITPDLPADQ